MHAHNYYVYIITNKNNTVLYIGMTNDINRRISEHRQKLIKGFTSKYNLTKIIYCEHYTYVNDAILREKQLKGWLRKRKDELISAANPKWDDVFEKEYNLNWHPEHSERSNI